VSVFYLEFNYNAFFWYDTHITYLSILNI